MSEPAVLVSVYTDELHARHADVVAGEFSLEVHFKQDGFPRGIHYCPKDVLVDEATDIAEDYVDQGICPEGMKIAD